MIGELSKGPIICRKNGYYYLRYREDGKLYDRYIGKDAEKVDAIREKLALRKHYTEMLSALKREQKTIHRLLEELAFDMHIGPVADDNVYRSIRLFETGVLDADETVKRLKTEVLQDQWTFHAEKMLSFIHFINSKEIRAEE